MPSTSASKAEYGPICDVELVEYVSKHNGGPAMALMPVDQQQHTIQNHALVCAQANSASKQTSEPRGANSSSVMPPTSPRIRPTSDPAPL